MSTVGVLSVIETNNSGSFSREIEKSFKLKLAETLGIENSKSIIIKAKEAKVDLLQNLDKIPPNTDFVISGLRAKEVYIEIDRNSNTKVSTGDLKKIIATMCGLPLQVVEYVPNLSLESNRNDSTKFVIKDTSVYFMVQIATMESKGVSENFYSTYTDNCTKKIFLSKLKCVQEKIILKADKDNYSSKVKYPFLNSGKQVYSHGVWFEIEKQKDKPSILKIKHTTSSRVCCDSIFEKIFLPNIINKDEIWNYKRCYLFTIQTENDTYKEVYVDFEAYREKDDIIIREAYLRYPDYKLTYRKFH